MHPVGERAKGLNQANTKQKNLNFFMGLVMDSHWLRAYDLYDFVKLEWLQFSKRLCTTSL